MMNHSIFWSGNLFQPAVTNSSTTAMTAATIEASARAKELAEERYTGSLEENCIEVKRCGWWWYFLTHLLCPSFNWALKQLWGNALKDPAGHLVAGVVGMWVWQICRKCCEGAARNWERPCPGDQVLTGCCNFFDLASQEIPWCKMMQACPLVLLHVRRGLDEARRYFLIYNLCNPQSCGTWHGEGESKQGSWTIAGGRPDLTKLQDPKSLFRFLATEGCVLHNQAHTKPFNRCDRNRGSAPQPPQFVNPTIREREREKVRKLFTSSSDDTPLRRRNLTVLKSWKMRGGITKCQNHRGKNVRGFWPFLTYCHDIEDISLLRRLESWMKVDRAKFRKVLMLFVCEVWRSKLSEVQREMLSLQARIKVGFGHSWVVEPSKLI